MNIYFPHELSTNCIIEILFLIHTLYIIPRMIWMKFRETKRKKKQNEDNQSRITNGFHGNRRLMKSISLSVANPQSYLFYFEVNHTCFSFILGNLALSRHHKPE